MTTKAKLLKRAADETMTKTEARRKAQELWGERAYVGTKRTSQWDATPIYIVRPSKDDVGGIGKSWEEAFANFSQRHPDWKPAQYEGDSELFPVWAVPAEDARALVHKLRASDPVPQYDYQIMVGTDGKTYLATPKKQTTQETSTVGQFISGFLFGKYGK